MTSPIQFGRYSDAQKYASVLPSWVPPAHQSRVAAYSVYEEIFWSHVNTLKVMNRGLDAADDPLYVPSARIVVETMDRYVGNALTVSAVPETGTTESQLAARQWFANLFARERFLSKYNAAKRDHLLTKGDMIWHITYDELKPAGTRISVHSTDPASYYPFFEDEVDTDVDNPDPNRLVMVKLVERFLDGETEKVRVQTYERYTTPGSIMSSLEVWLPEEWYAEDKSPETVLVSPTALPAQITALPVYHVPNGGNGSDFGDSELRGLLVLQAALNQAATDEDLSVALLGLGVYATDEAGRPRAEDGTLSPWGIQPGAVIENSKGLRRVEGITTLEPYTDHINRLEGWMGDATGATDAARGRVEVAEAESGVALALRLGPTLAKAAVKDQHILDVFTQMFYDLTMMWAPLDPQEGVGPFQDVRVIPVLGDKLPLNRKAEVELWSSMVLAGLVSAATARKALMRYGFEFDPSEAELMLAEKVATASAEVGDTAQDRENNERGGSALNSPPEGE